MCSHQTSSSPSSSSLLCLSNCGLALHQSQSAKHTKQAATSQGTHFSFVFGSYLLFFFFLKYTTNRHRQYLAFPVPRTPNILLHFYTFTLHSSPSTPNRATLRPRPLVCARRTRTQRTARPVSNNTSKPLSTNTSRRRNCILDYRVEGE